MCWISISKRVKVSNDTWEYLNSTLAIYALKLWAFRRHWVFIGIVFLTQFFLELIIFFVVKLKFISYHFQLSSSIFGLSMYNKKLHIYLERIDKLPHKMLESEFHYQTIRIAVIPADWHFDYSDPTLMNCWPLDFVSAAADFVGCWEYWMESP